MGSQQVVANDALMLKHQAISIHNADLNIHCIGPVSYKNIAHTVNSMRWNDILKKMTQSFEG